MHIFNISMCFKGNIAMAESIPCLQTCRQVKSSEKYFSKNKCYNFSNYLSQRKPWVEVWCVFMIDLLCVTEQDMLNKSIKDLLPQPKLLHHIVEDFLTSWDGWTSHLLPLRRFLEEVVGRDLRSYFADTCMKLALTHMDVPLSCQMDFMEGHGLVPTYSLAHFAKDPKLLL